MGTIILQGAALASPAGSEAGGEGAPESQWFDNAAFGYWKITVERPLRLRSQLTHAAIKTLRFASGDEALRAELFARHGESLYDQFARLRPEIESWLRGDDEADESDRDAEDARPTRRAVPEKRRRKLLDPATWRRDLGLVEVAQAARAALGADRFDDHNVFRDRFEAFLKARGLKLPAAEKKLMYRAASWRDEAAPPVIARRARLKPGEPFAPGFDGRYLVADGAQRSVVEYEPDSELRDTEQVSLQEPGGIDAFFAREVLPHAPDAWIDRDKTQIGYEISFARYFYKPAPLRTLDEIRAELLRLERQTEGLLRKIVGAER